jgi:hypothetical protein
MAILMNNTAHLIIIGGKRFIPRRPVENVDLDKIKKQYPEVDSMIKAGQMLVKTKAQAKVIEAKEEASEVEELKAYAKAHGIKTGRANTKESLLKAIKKAETEALEKKV